MFWEQGGDERKVKPQVRAEKAHPPSCLRKKKMSEKEKKARRVGGMRSLSTPVARKVRLSHLFPLKKRFGESRRVTLKKPISKTIENVLVASWEIKASEGGGAGSMQRVQYNASIRL